MRSGDKIYKTVFLFGAGASRGAIDHVLLNRKRIKPPLNSDFFKIAQTYARARGQNSTASQGLTRLRKVFSRDLPSKGTPTMEEAFSLLYVAKDFPEIYNRGRGRKSVAGERKEIADFLYILFPILTMLDQDTNKKTAYDDLVTNLTDDDTIITLNYDTMLDSALFRKGWDPQAGYAISGNASKTMNWKRKSNVENQLRVKLLKLHGSMNWFVKGELKNLKKVFSSKPVRITAPRQNELSGHIRQIVPPLYGKIFEHTHWQKLWHEAFKALCDADMIVIVGCSLIDTDFHLRALFSQVARTRKSNGQKFQVAVFADTIKVRRKWQRLLKGSFVHKWEYKNFQSFVADTG